MRDFTVQDVFKHYEDEIVVLEAGASARVRVALEGISSCLNLIHQHVIDDECTGESCLRLSSRDLGGLISAIATCSTVISDRVHGHSPGSFCIDRDDAQASAYVLSLRKSRAASYKG